MEPATSDTELTMHFYTGLTILWSAFSHGVGNLGANISEALRIRGKYLSASSITSQVLKKFTGLPIL